MATTSPWNITLFDDNSAFAPVQTPFNTLAGDLNTALNAGAFRQYATKALMDAATGAAGQHASVTADPTAANNGDYRWDTATSKWVATSLRISGSIKRSTAAGTFSAGVWSLLNTSSFWQVDQPAIGVAAFAGKWTAPVDGWYEVGLGIQLDATVNAILAIKKNNSAVSGDGAIASMSAVGYASDTAVSLSKKVRLSANDYLQGAIFVSGSAPWNTTNLDGSFFSIKWIEALR